VTPAEHALWELWIGAFSARTDAYVLNSGVTVKEPLTAPVCEAALHDGHSISGYLARSEGGVMVTNVAAVDVDTDFLEAQLISAYMWEQQIPNLTVKSRRGGHIWVWTQDEQYMPVKASVVRRALTNLVALSLPNLIDSLPHIEVFPKPRGTGALRMPLFKHPKDGVVYPVIDRSGKESIDRQQVYDLISPPEFWTPFKTLQRHAGDQPYAETLTPVPEALRPSYGVSVPAGMTVSATLQSIGITNAQPGHSVRCPWHTDKHASLSILADDMRAICKAPECPAHNNGRGVGSLAMRRLLTGS
jgi:hypothetical protein